MSPVVHYLELAALFLAFSVALLPRLPLEQAISCPTSLELLATSSQVSVLPLLVFSEALQVLYQALSEASFLEPTVSQAEFCLELEVFCPTLAALLVPFQQQSAELFRMSAQVLEVL